MLSMILSILRIEERKMTKNRKKIPFTFEVKLDNGKTIKFENERINIYNSSRYMDIFKERKNSLLEDLLKLR